MLVLEIPLRDACTHPQASVLGSNLQAGEKMYLDLQGIYLSSALAEMEESYYDEVEMDYSSMPAQEAPNRPSPPASNRTHLTPVKSVEGSDRLKPNRTSADYEKICGNSGQTLSLPDTPENVYDSASPVHVVPRRKPPPKPPRPEQSIRESLDYEDIDSGVIGLCVPQPMGNIEENIYDDVEGVRQSTVSLAEGHYEFMQSASMERNHNVDDDYEDV